jgi:uncharacterized protein (DUF488 family)
MEPQICYTIGHSNHSLDVFLSLLKKNHINFLIDVRSYPYSKYTPQFDKTNLEQYLKSKNIDYSYFGNELGGLQKDPSVLLPDGRTDYNKVREKKEYQKCIDYLLTQIHNGKRISLMCVEKDPFDCHRFVLLSYSLKIEGIQVFHILENGELLSNEILEGKLQKKYAQTTLFDSQCTNDNSIEKLYEKRNIDIAKSINPKEGL